MPELLFLVGGLGGVLLSIGVIVYAVNLMLKQREEKKRKREAEAMPDHPPASEVPAPPDTPSAASVPPSAVSEAALRSAPASSKYQTEVARLLRDRDTGELVVEVDGRQYLKAMDIGDDAVGRRVAGAARELLNWAGLPAGARESLAPPPSFPTANSALAVSPPFDTIHSMNPLEQIRILRERAKLSRVPPLKSVAEQIDDVLQERIGGTPLAVRGVKLLTAPDGGVRVQVGAEYFEGVDAVPDEEIRQAIREAVRAWEANRQSPNPSSRAR